MFLEASCAGIDDLSSLGLYPGSLRRALTSTWEGLSKDNFVVTKATRAVEPALRVLVVTVLLILFGRRGGLSSSSRFR